MAANPLKKKAAVDTADVQGLVLQGYGKHRAAAYLVLEVTDDARARAWLGSVLPEVTLGEGRPAGAAVNLALTSSGLAKLGLPSTTLSGFSLEFLEGMTSAHRSRLLGDEGAAAPAHWSWGAPDGPEVDLLLLVFASDAEALAPVLERHRTGLSEGGLREVATLDTRGHRPRRALRLPRRPLAAGDVRRRQTRAGAAHRRNRGSSCSATSTSTGSTRAHPSCPAPRTPRVCCRRARPDRPERSRRCRRSWRTRTTSDATAATSWCARSCRTSADSGASPTGRPGGPTAGPTRTRVRRSPPGWSDAGRAARR